MVPGCCKWWLVGKGERDECVQRKVVEVVLCISDTQ